MTDMKCQKCGLVRESGKSYGYSCPHGSNCEAAFSQPVYGTTSILDEGALLREVARLSAERDALVAAAYEAAATCTEWTAWGERHNLTESTRRAIRFLTPSHATEALDRIKADARAEVVGTQAAADVLTERARQISAEGWTPDHDDLYVDGEIAMAAACYSLLAVRNELSRFKSAVCSDFVKLVWPWDAKWRKPTDRRRDLVKAGALIIAEIERMDRAAMSTDTKGEKK